MSVALFYRRKHYRRTINACVVECQHGSRQDWQRRRTADTGVDNVLQADRGKSVDTVACQREGLLAYTHRYSVDRCTGWSIEGADVATRADGERTGGLEERDHKDYSSRSTENTTHNGVVHTLISHCLPTVWATHEVIARAIVGRNLKQRLSKLESEVISRYGPSWCLRLRRSGEHLSLSLEMVLPVESQLLERQ